MIPEHLQKHLASSDSDQLRVIATFLLGRALGNGQAAAKLSDAIRDMLDLLRAGRITEATEIAERIVCALDVAGAADDASDQATLAIEPDALLHVPAQGRA